MWRSRKLLNGLVKKVQLSVVHFQRAAEQTCSADDTTALVFENFKLGAPITKAPLNSDLTANTSLRLAAEYDH